MTDSSVRRRVFVIGLGFSPHACASIYIFRCTIVARPPHIHASPMPARSRSREIFFFFFLQFCANRRGRYRRYSFRDVAAFSSYILDSALLREKLRVSTKFTSLYLIATLTGKFWQNFESHKTERNELYIYVCVFFPAMQRNIGKHARYKWITVQRKAHGTCENPVIMKINFVISSCWNEAFSLIARSAQFPSGRAKLARRSFFVVKFHANLFNGSLAIANKREDELFAIRHIYIYTCIYIRARTYIYIRVVHIQICIYDSRRPHVRRTRSLCHTMAKNIKLILYLVRSLA